MKRKTIKHKGHEVHKGFKEFPSCPFVTFVFKKNFVETH